MTYVLGSMTGERGFRFPVAVDFCCCVATALGRLLARLERNRLDLACVYP